MLGRSGLVRLRETAPSPSLKELEGRPPPRKWWGYGFPKRFLMGHGLDLRSVNLHVGTSGQKEVPRPGTHLRPVETPEVRCLETRLGEGKSGRQTGCMVDTLRPVFSLRETWGQRRRHFTPILTKWDTPQLCTSVPYYTLDLHLSIFDKSCLGPCTNHDLFTINNNDNNNDCLRKSCL